MKSFEKWLLVRENYEDDYSLTNMATYFNRVADAIAEKAGKRRTVVILGRDAWFLVPLLRHRGVKTQYFLYSRLQIPNKNLRQQADPATIETWLREVPRNSLVIDTGYAGSIINYIRTFDPSAEGMLMSSSTKNYPEIDDKQLSSDKRQYMVGDIELFPKLINRSRTYRGLHAITKPLPGDDRTDYGDIGDRKDFTGKRIMAKNKAVLMKAGLPEEMADQYKNFSGIPMHQRIGSRDYVTHMMDVDKSRQKIKLTWQEKLNTALKAIRHGKKYEWNWDKIPKNYFHLVYEDIITAIQDEKDALNQKLFDLNGERLNIINAKFTDPDELNAVNERLEKARVRQRILNQLINSGRTRNRNIKYGYEDENEN